MIFNNLICQNCGSSLDLDLDNITTYCPHCGHKLLIETDQLADIIAHKERTKQVQIDYDYKKKELDKQTFLLSQEYKISAGILAAFIFICIFSIIVLLISVR